MPGCAGQRSWLVVEPLPAYAPESNPVEPLWASPKWVLLKTCQQEQQEGGGLRLLTFHSDRLGRVTIPED
jgi:hypothetical protein